LGIVYSVKRGIAPESDAGVFSNIILDNGLLCVTADHSTPCISKGHTDDPVPILIAGNNVIAVGSPRFPEEYARKGKLGTVKHGYEFMDILKKLSS
jgi:2,3-bisphosphoglycerate-independent phosphoglycerate mutase